MPSRCLLLSSFVVSNKVFIPRGWVMIGLSLAFESFFAQFPCSEGCTEDLVLVSEMWGDICWDGLWRSSYFSNKRDRGSWLNPVPFLLALNVDVLFGGVADILHCQYTMLIDILHTTPACNCILPDVFLCQKSLSPVCRAMVWSVIRDKKQPKHKSSNINGQSYE